jgi:hypothetical protein
MRDLTASVVAAVAMVGAAAAVLAGVRLPSPAVPSRDEPCAGLRRRDLKFLDRDLDRHFRRWRLNGANENRIVGTWWLRYAPRQIHVPGAIFGLVGGPFLGHRRPHRLGWLSDQFPRASINHQFGDDHHAAHTGLHQLRPAHRIILPSDLLKLLEF